MEFYHRPIMLNEVIEGLNVREGIYFDGTVGGGGHSYGILSAHPGARLIATDRDDEALEAARARLAPFAGRFELYRSNFKDYANVLYRAGADKLDGVLLDFGISSHQVDDPLRGFSYRTAAAPLDMRMDRTSPLTAEDVVNGYPEERLFAIIREYGEEPFAAVIARAIVRERNKARIATCGQLKELVESCLPPKLRSAACARQTFQAIRIEVNGELDGLEDCVRGLARSLRDGGRICILTFHSLEDRIVKRVFGELNESCVCPKSFPVCVCGKQRELKLITKKPLVASEEERAENPRSKSAKLRIAEKIGMNSTRRE